MQKPAQDKNEFNTGIKVKGIRDLFGRSSEILAIIGQFGLLGTLKALIDRTRGKKSQLLVEVTSPGLHFPLSIRSTLSDMWCYAEVISRSSYKLPLALQAEADCQTIVDIGAYNGTSMAYFASCYPNAKIIAIEPDPDNYTVLKTNAAKYGVRVRTINAAVVPAKGKIQRLMLGSAADAMTNVFVPAQNNTGQDDIDTITPQDIVKLLGQRQVDILKVDIEGAEKALFTSPAIGGLLKITKILLIETHDAYLQGSHVAVSQAALKNGLEPVTLGGHTEIYLRPR